MPRTKGEQQTGADANGQARFEGLKVSEVEFELGGGGTTRETPILANLGDILEGTWRGKVVNVKHPLKSGEVVRVQTINIEEARIDGIVEKFEPPPEQPELSEAEPD